MKRDYTILKAPHRISYLPGHNIYQIVRPLFCHSSSLVLPPRLLCENTRFLVCVKSERDLVLDSNKKYDVLVVLLVNWKEEVPKEPLLFLDKNENIES